MEGKKQALFSYNRVFYGMEIILKSIFDAKEWQNAQCPVLSTNSNSAQSHSNPYTLQATSPPLDAVVCNVDAARDKSIELWC